MEDASIYEDSIVCVALDGAEIVGSVKVTRWNEETVLPIQKLFGINPLRFKEKGAQSIWHIGRFAISKTAKEGAKLLKKLIAIAVYPISCAPNSIMLAECDSKFVKILNLMGIRTEMLARGIDYLGSETLPICSTQNSLYAYLCKSPHYTEAMDFYIANDLAKYMVLTSNREIEPVSYKRTLSLLHADTIIPHAIIPH